MSDDVRRRMLAVYRDAIEPTAQDRERVLRAIAVAEDRMPDASLRRAVVLALLAAAATIVLAIAWSTMRGTAVLGEAAPAKLEAPHGKGARPAHSYTEASTIPATLPPRNATPPVVEIDAPRPSAPPREQDPAPASPSETVLLARAIDAFDREAYADVLRLVSEHRTTFPASTNAPDARALRILALCKLGRHREGRGEATIFLRELPRAPYRDRITKTCAVD
jgi:hypothetical protein